MAAMNVSLTPQSSIMNLNAQAVELMRHEQYRPALSKLKTALRQLRSSIIPMADRSSESHDSKRNSPSTALQADPLQVHAVSVSDGNGECRKLNIASSMHAFVLFDRLLLLTGSDAAVCATAKSEERASGALIYNMALLHHLVGLKGGPGHENKLLKAIRLYDMVTETVSETDALESASDCLLYLATWNNKGMIHSYFYEANKTQDCSLRLRFALSTMSHTSLLEDDIFHFQLNIFLLIIQHGHAPAA